IESLGGKVTKREDWGLRNLAYRINKNRKGYYVFMNLDAPSDAIKEVDRVMRLDENIIRHLIVKVDALEEGPSVMLAPKFAKKEDTFFEQEEKETF
ncbi:MAG: 30S ribosomal protein S6, partial [Alphaproteobacteria bacterium]|nr:30S ribosomal protein S6 [Alphaproteobacteria bacterium]